MRRLLLIVTAALEAPLGVSLLAAPSLPASLLLGSTLDAPAARAVGRVAGAALLALGLVCWLTRDEPKAGRGVVAALLIYNLAAVAILVGAGLGPGPAGIGLWPGAVLHTALAAWCIPCLRRPSVQ